MPTSKSNPTAGEIAQDDVPQTTDPQIFQEGVETNFPVADLGAEDILPDAVVAEDQVASDGEPGEVWAIYTGQQPSQRILTVEDLHTLGDKKATERLVWDRNNRFRLEVSEVHPMVLDYIETQDGNFRVVRP